MKFIDVYYFAYEKHICGADFKNKEQKVSINTSYIESITEPSTFHLPISGAPVGMYAQIKMHDGYSYFITEDAYKMIDFDWLYTN